MVTLFYQLFLSHAAKKAANNPAAKKAALKKK